MEILELLGGVAQLMEGLCYLYDVIRAACRGAARVVGQLLG